MTDLILIRVNCPSSRDAHRIAEAMIDAKLVACANVEGPIQCIYEWDGEVQREYEFILWLKAPEEHWAAIDRQVDELHPHDTPAIIAIPCVHANARYSAWVKDTTKKPE